MIGTSCIHLANTLSNVRALHEWHGFLYICNVNILCSWHMLSKVYTPCEWHVLHTLNKVIHGLHGQSCDTTTCFCNACSMDTLSKVNHHMNKRFVLKQDTSLMHAQMIASSCSKALYLHSHERAIYFTQMLFLNTAAKLCDSCERHAAMLYRKTCYALQCLQECSLYHIFFLPPLSSEVLYDCIAQIPYCSTVYCNRVISS